MNAEVILVIIVILIPLFMIVSNKLQCKGKVAAIIIRNGLPLEVRRCKVLRGFIVYNGCGYRMDNMVHQDIGWPPGRQSFFQESLQAYLIDEDDAVPHNWRDVGHGEQDRKKRAREVAEALNPELLGNYLHKQQQQGATKKKWNIRKALPFVLIAGGILLAVGYFMFLR